MSRIKMLSKNAYHKAMRSISHNFVMTAPTALFTEFDRIKDNIRKTNPDDIALAGYKVYSQNDEDGIIAAIFDKIGAGSTFMEIGVENGIECNTHFLALKGWRGAWIEGSGEKCTEIEGDLGGRVFPDRFKVVEAMVDKGNIAAIYGDISAFCGVENLDFFSLDIDGNDLYVVDSLLESGARPSVICIEYNGKFPPPLSISINPNSQHGWGYDDFFGASLQAFYDVLVKHGYKLVTCNITGANGFFVRQELGHLFPDVTPTDVWRVLRLDLCPLPAGHKPTLKWMREAVNRPAAQD